MNFLKNLFQRLSFNKDGNDLNQLFVPPDSSKARPKPQRNAQTNSKSAGLTQDQLAEVLSWLSRY